MPAPDYVLRQGDSGQTITSVCTDEDGAAVNISGATVRFLMAPLTGGDAVLAATAQNENGTNQGQVSYEWEDTDSAMAGHFIAEFEVTFGGGAVVTFPNAGYIVVQITEQITEAI
jgi:hypothetical protein